MTDIIALDLRGSTYDIVDQAIRDLVQLPKKRKWNDIDSRAFWCSIPKDRTPYFNEAMLFTKSKEIQENENRRNQEIETFKNFRSADFFANMFHTDKALHGRRYESKIMFDTSAYEDLTHAHNLELFEKLAKVYHFNNNVVQIYSILKDQSQGLNSRNPSTPFVRNHIAILLVHLHS